MIVERACTMNSNKHIRHSQGACASMVSFTLIHSNVHPRFNLEMIITSQQTEYDCSGCKPHIQTHPLNRATHNKHENTCLDISLMGTCMARSNHRHTTHIRRLKECSLLHLILQRGSPPVHRRKRRVDTHPLILGLLGLPSMHLACMTCLPGPPCPACLVCLAWLAWFAKRAYAYLHALK